MRCIGLVCTLLVGCGFRAPQGGAGADAGEPGEDGPGNIDAATDSMPPIDGPPAPTVRTRRLDIVDAQVAGGPHASFPLLVAITADWLRTTTAGGDVQNASGFDIGFFADAAGATRLAHEVESYNATTGALVAWVRVPSLTTATELFLRYGDPSITTSQQNVNAVWSAGFSAVWHMGGVADSTAGNNAGTDAGTSGAGGQIGSARGFNGSDNSINVGSGTSIDDIFVGGGTVEAWFRAADWGEASRGRILEKGDTTTGETNGWYISIDNANVQGSILFGHGVTSGNGVGAWSTPPNSIALNQWTHVAAVYDQGSITNVPTIYINGTQRTLSVTDAPSGSLLSDAAHPARIGNRGAGDRAFDGLIDELRLSTDSRSATWIQTTYRNQSNPGTFLTVGDPL